MSAPTALAQRAAQRAGVELLAFVREGRWSRYSA
jgi:formate dehydrogenase assembly factor FdhD